MSSASGRRDGHRQMTENPSDQIDECARRLRQSSRVAFGALYARCPCACCCVASFYVACCASGAVISVLCVLCSAPCSSPTSGVALRRRCLLPCALLCEGCVGGRACGGDGSGGDGGSVCVDPDIDVVIDGPSIFKVYRRVGCWPGARCCAAAALLLHDLR